MDRARAMIKQLEEIKTSKLKKQVFLKEIAEEDKQGKAQAIQCMLIITTKAKVPFQTRKNWVSNKTTFLRHSINL